jgi:hypothetical protein
MLSTIAILVTSSCMLQAGCTCSIGEACFKCWRPCKEQPGHFVVNLANSIINKPKARLDLATFTTSSIPNQLVIPTCLEGAEQLKPGMVDNRLAEVAMVSHSGK